MNNKVQILKNSFILFPFVFLSSMANAMIQGIDTGADYDAIGSLIAADSGVPHCSATLISKDWIITAAHCLEGGSEEEPVQYKPSDLFFQIGNDGLNPRQKIQITELITFDQSKYPEIQNVHIYAIDIAFAKLAAPVQMVDGEVIQPIPLSLSPLTLSSNSGSPEIVGYGQTNPLGYGEHFYRRQKANYSITAIQGNPFLNLFSTEAGFANYLQRAHPGEEDGANQLLFKATIENGFWIHAWDPRGRDAGIFTQTPRTGLSNSCNGDSGGPFLTTQQGQKQVRGIIIRGFNGTTLGCLELGSIIAIFGADVKKTMEAHQIPFID